MCECVCMNEEEEERVCAYVCVESRKVADIQVCLCAYVL